MAAWPWYSYGSGGMVSQASVVSMVSTASMSPASTAAAKRPARWRPRAESGTGARSRPTRSWASSAARAHCRAPLTEVSVLPSMSATSAAR